MKNLTTSHTKKFTVNASLEDVFEFIVAEDVLPKILKKYFIIPAVKGSTIHAGDWETPGSYRTVLFANGDTLREELTHFERPNHFAYRISEFSSFQKYLVSHGIGQWWFKANGGRTEVKWTYTFYAKGRLKRFFLRPFVKHSFGTYMKRSIELIKKQIENGNRFVLITGASSGIGEATTYLLAKSGYTVLAGVRSEKAFEKLEQLHNPNVVPLKLDVTSEKEIVAAVQHVKSLVKDAGLFALINNAGNNYSTPTECYDAAQARNLMETHFWGMASLTKHCIPLMQIFSRQQNEGARVINVGSVGSISAFPFIQFYNAAKFAILGFTESLRFELKPQNIHFSVILPGSVKTEIWRRTEESIQITLDILQDQQASLYRENILSASKLSSSLEQGGVSSKDAAKIFKQVLETQKPKFKYFIGIDAKLVNLMVRYLSDSIRHWIMNMRLRLK